MEAEFGFNLKLKVPYRTRFFIGGLPMVTYHPEIPNTTDFMVTWWNPNWKNDANLDRKSAILNLLAVPLTGADEVDQ